MTSAPIARVRLDSPLPHLDRPFDYRVPPTLVDTVSVGSRVRVPFAGRLTGAVVTELTSESSFGGRLLEVKSSSAIPSFTPAALELARDVARRYGGSWWDVARLMAPPRVAAVEKRDWSAPGNDPAYKEALVRLEPQAARVTLRPGDRVVWEALPPVESTSGGPTATPADALVSIAVQSLGDTGSAIIVVPDARAVRLVLASLERIGLSRWSARSGGQVAVLDHDDGPNARFGSYLAAMHGHARVVVGTRPTVLQPVPHLSALVLWDEGNSVYEELHSPYFHVRTVAAMRAAPHTAVVLGGYALSVDAIALVEHGWARAERASRDRVREATPTVDIMTSARREAEGASGRHWMPGSVWRSVLRALDAGPVGIVVPRAGYVGATACARCQAWAECRECESPLAIPASGADPVCVAHGHAQPHWHCPECHHPHLKQVRQGVERLAEQLQRMVPAGTPVTISSSGTGVVEDFAVDSGVVISTPAALPAVREGYRHIVIVDAGVPVFAGLGGELRAVRWWLNAAALARPRGAGGAVTVVGDVPDMVRRALSSWNPVEAARDDYAERQEIGLPPHRRHIRLTGDDAWVTAALRRAGVEDGKDRATVVTRPDGASVLVTRGSAAAVVEACREVQQEASKAGGDLRLRVDGPLE